MNVFSFVLAAALILILSPSAHAVVPSAGAFVPSQCGNQEMKGVLQEKIASVCIGRVADEASTPAVAFRLSDGTERVYRIANVSEVPHLIEIEAFQYAFDLIDADGNTASMNVSRPESSAAGTTVARVAGALSFTEGEASYLVTNFQPMFVIQGL